MIKNDWTLGEIAALPAGEHDFFDRKSGRLISDSQFRQDLGKAFSGIANSGGGHILLGVADDGTVDGVPKLRGRTCVREWIEQVIPNVVEPVPTAFRVHRVEATSDCAIPQDGVVVVIDIDDSHLAPFQSRSSKVYYYRVGGHSVPAPHFYLEAIRNRLVAPSLKVELSGGRVIRAIATESYLFVQLVVDLNVSNDANVSPKHWYIDLRYNKSRIGDDGPVRRDGFPRGVLRLSGDSTRTNLVLPGQTVRVREILGLLVRTQEFGIEELPVTASSLLDSENQLCASVVTESHVGEWSPLDMEPLHDVVSADEIRRFVPDVSDAKQTGSLGGGINSLEFVMKEFNSPEDHAHFHGVVENTTTELFRDFRMVVAFFDKNSNPSACETCKVGFLAPDQKRPWSGFVKAAEIWGAESVQLFYYDKSWIESD
jgi:hypothetical protein